MAETRSKPKSTPANGARTRTADLHDRVTRLETRFDSEVRYLATKEDIARSEEKIVRIEKDMATKQETAAIRQETAAIRQETAAIRQDMATKQDLAELDAKTERYISEQRAESKRDIAAMETRMTKWIAGFGLTLIAVNIAIEALS